MNEKPPRLGFLGLGWIGLQRMQALNLSGLAQVCAIADPSEIALSRAARVAPKALCSHSLEQILRADLDGLVIATPSALHAEQSVAALKRGIPVFCQKPLGRNAEEVERIVRTAQEADCLLGVDLCYRFTTAIAKIQLAIQSGKLGRIHAANLVFHNAYGPDKDWFYDGNLSGGGCVIDLATHLVDLAVFIIQSPVTTVSSRLFRKGTPIRTPRGRSEVEDYAIARLDFASGATAQIACSWNLNAGQDAIIEASFYGDKAGACLRNVNGSFYDFTAELFRKTSKEILAQPPDDWGGRALLDWARRLAISSQFDESIEEAIEVARILDAIYESSPVPNFV